MRYLLFTLTLSIVFCTSLAAKEVSISSNVAYVTFDEIEVESGSMTEQVFVLDSYKGRLKNISGNAYINDNYGKYSKIFPITSTYDNSSHYYILTLGFSNREKNIICTRQCWNNSEESYNFNSIDIKVSYLLFK